MDDPMDAAVNGLVFLMYMLLLLAIYVALFLPLSALSLIICLIFFQWHYIPKLVEANIKFWNNGIQVFSHRLP